MKTTSYYVFLLGLFTMAFVSANLFAQTSFRAVYTFSNVVSDQGGTEDPTPPPVVESLLFTPFKAVGNERFGTLGDHPNAGGAFSFKGWPQAVDSINFGSLHPNRYYEFALSPQAGYRLKVETIRFKARRSGTGPRCYALRSSNDRYEQNLPASYYGKTKGRILADNGFEFSDTDTYDYSQVSVDQESSATLTFRLYAYGVEASSGVFCIDDVEIEGQIYSDTSHRIPLFEHSWESFPLEPEDGMRHVFYTTSPQGQDSLVHDWVLPRAYFDAVLNLYQFDTTAIRIDSLNIRIQDSLGNDATTLFQIAGVKTETLYPMDNGQVLMRLIPRQQAAVHDTAYYRVSGSLHYTKLSTQTRVVNYLYPSSIKVAPMARCECHYFVPVEPNRSLGVLLHNTSACSLGPLQLISHIGPLSDSIRIGELPPHALYGFNYPLGQRGVQGHRTQLLREAWMSPDSTLLPMPVFHTLTKEVLLYGRSEYDDRPDYLVNDSSEQTDLKTSSRKIYSSQGGFVDVVSADTLMADKILSRRDTLIHYTIHPQGQGWQYAKGHLSINQASDAEIVSICRLSDSTYLPLENTWFTSDYLIHILDTFPSETPQQYAVLFTDKGGLSSVRIPVYYTEISDSICLGNAYTSNGFQLPIQDVPGDYEFRDTLMAANGADSVVILSLNVCALPDVPEFIYGDSVIVRSGNYIYSISPVPNATFYLWTVIPSDWKIKGKGETVSLNIPYNGSGRISVRAVNRCGQSSERELELLLSDLQSSSASTFSIYPNPTTSDFSLETGGIRGKTSISISDMNGRLIHTQTRVINEDKHLFTFSLSNYQQGSYIITITNENVNISEKILKE